MVVHVIKCLDKGLTIPCVHVIDRASLGTVMRWLILMTIFNTPRHGQEWFVFKLFVNTTGGHDI